MSQGRVRDIIYKGTKEQIERAVMPDGNVPLVSSVLISQEAAEQSE